MRKIFPYIAFLCLTGFTAANGVQVMARGCNNNMLKQARIECDNDDSKCQPNKADKNALDKTIK